MAEAPTRTDDRERMSWEDLGAGARALAQKIVDDGYRPDIVLSIARGGLLVGGALAYALGVKNTFTVNVEFYTDVHERLPLPIMLPPVPDLVDLTEAHVILADDVADTGQTLALVKGYCGAHVAEIRAAVLYEKPWSTFPSDYVWRRTSRWVVFPWSAEAPVGAVR